MKNWLKPLLLIAGLCFVSAGAVQLCQDVGLFSFSSTGQFDELVIEAPARNMSPEQLAILTSPEVRKYMADASQRNGPCNIRFISSNAEFAVGEEHWREMAEAARGHKLPLTVTAHLGRPFVVESLPRDVPAMLSFLKSHGG